MLNILMPTRSSSWQTVTQTSTPIGLRVAKFFSQAVWPCLFASGLSFLAPVLGNNVFPLALRAVVAWIGALVCIGPNLRHEL